MTIKEANVIYDRDVKEHIDRHKKRTKIFMVIWAVSSIVLFLIGVFLINKSKTFPHDIILGLEFESFEETLYYILGVGTIITAIAIVISSEICLIISLVRGPRSFAIQNKKLYYNYLLCEDLDKDRKEYYKLKIQEMVSSESVSRISSNMNPDITTAIGAATLFNMINKN